MADSVRQQIVDALEAQLVSAVTSVSGRVFVQRKTPLSLAELPCLELCDLEAQTTMDVVGLRTHTMQATLIYQAKTATSATAARNALDEMVQAIFANYRLGGLCEMIELLSHDINTEVKGDVLAAAQIMITITYRTAYGRI